MKTDNSIRKCILKDNDEVRALLEERFSELELYNRDVLRDAEEKGYHLSESMLSKYMSSGNVKGSLSQADIIWLCYRYGIDINLNPAKILPFNDKECLKRLKKHFK